MGSYRSSWFHVTVDSKGLHDERDLFRRFSQLPLWLQIMKMGDTDKFIKPPNLSGNFRLFPWLAGWFWPSSKEFISILLSTTPFQALGGSGLHLDLTKCNRKIFMKCKWLETLAQDTLIVILSLCHRRPFCSVSLPFKRNYCIEAVGWTSM